MFSFITGVVATIVAIFVAWLAKYVFWRRHLYLIQPKLFAYSELGGNENTSTIEITVVNSGRRSEEMVRVQFAPNFNYSVLASSTPNLTVDKDGVLSIDRLTPKQELMLIIYITGGEFRKDHILGITSKDTIGAIKNTVQDARTATIGTAVGAIFILLFLLAIGYAMGVFLNPMFWPGIQQYLFRCNSLNYQLANREVNGTYQISKQVENALTSSVTIASVCRSGNYIHVSFELTNRTKDRLTYTLNLSAASDNDRPIGNLDYMLNDQLLYPGTSKSVTLSEYLPKNARPQRITIEATTQKPDSTQEITTEDINLGIT